MGQRLMRALRRNMSGQLSRCAHTVVQCRLDSRRRRRLLHGRRGAPINQWPRLEQRATCRMRHRRRPVRTGRRRMPARRRVYNSLWKCNLTRHPTHVPPASTASGIAPQFHG
eukprot:scaffold4550_cov128-Isochrysis_galbana.AAC.2